MAQAIAEAPAPVITTFMFPMDLPEISKALIIDLFPIKSFNHWTTINGESLLTIINPILKIQRIENPALAFGIEPGIFSVLINPITILLTILIIYYLYKSLTKENNRMKNFSLALILGGAFGNLFDRLINGKVVDFINMGITDDIRWNYIFNLADTFITIGMIILLFSDLFIKKKKKNDRQKDKNI